jgi:hypothetical protein
MEALKVALEIYGMGFIISFLVAVMIKALLFIIRYFNHDTSEEASK